MPPAPIGDTISYGPSLVPEVSAIDARNYSPDALQRMRIDSGRLFGNPSLGGYFPLARDPGVSGIDSHKPASVLILPSMPSPALVRDDG
jgi:hypothetical protein